MTLSDDSRRIVDAARADYGPSEDDRARVAASLAVQMTAGAASSATAAGVLAGKGTVLALAALVVVGGASAGYWWSTSEARTRVAGHAQPGSSLASATPSARIPEVADSPGPAVPRSIAAPAKESVKPPVRANRGYPAPAPRTAAAKIAAPEPGPNVAGEIALLEEAQRALANGRAEHALQLLERHAHDFPRGAFVQERTAARIIALCALGRVTTARSESSAFVAEFPTSPLADRVRAACEPQLGSGAARK